MIGARHYQSKAHTFAQINVDALATDQLDAADISKFVERYGERAVSALLVMRDGAIEDANYSMRAITNNFLLPTIMQSAAHNIVSIMLFTLPCNLGIIASSMIGKEIDAGDMTTGCDITEPIPSMAVPATLQDLMMKSPTGDTYMFTSAEYCVCSASPQVTGSMIKELASAARLRFDSIDSILIKTGVGKMALLEGENISNANMFKYTRKLAGGVVYIAMYKDGKEARLVRDSSLREL